MFLPFKALSFCVAKLVRMWNSRSGIFKSEYGRKTSEESSLVSSMELVSAVQKTLDCPFSIMKRASD